MMTEEEEVAIAQIGGSVIGLLIGGGHPAPIEEREEVLTMELALALPIGDRGVVLNMEHAQAVVLDG